MDVRRCVPSVSLRDSAAAECICYRPYVPESCRRCTALTDDVLDRMNDETAAERLARRTAEDAQRQKRKAQVDVLCYSEDDVVQRIRRRLAAQRRTEEETTAAMEELTLAQLACRYIVLRGPASHP